VPDRGTPRAHVRRCVTARCRRAEVRDASVGLNVSKALDVGARAARCGARWGMQRGDDRLPLPSLFSLPITDHPRHPYGERHTPPRLPRFHRTASHRAHP